MNNFSLRAVTKTNAPESVSPEAGRSFSNSCAALFFTAPPRAVPLAERGADHSTSAESNVTLLFRDRRGRQHVIISDDWLSIFEEFLVQRAALGLKPTNKQKRKLRRHEYKY